MPYWMLHEFVHHEQQFSAIRHFTLQEQEKAVGDHRDADLRVDGISADTIQPLDVQMLFDPFEE
ncbi:hypothetical protein ACFFK0_15310 [Paenibacillus chartarius]|uniref:Uncharacterized protein n=1 Tax=Paenibacillus chartarius TaxID=747481 RepID=A0ABV6DMC7_9BACL